MQGHIQTSHLQECAADADFNTGLLQLAEKG